MVEHLPRFIPECVPHSPSGSADVHLVICYIVRRLTWIISDDLRWFSDDCRWFKMICASLDMRLFVIALVRHNPSLFHLGNVKDGINTSVSWHLNKQMLLCSHWHGVNMLRSWTENLFLEVLLKKIEMVKSFDGNRKAEDILYIQVSYVINLSRTGLKSHSNRVETLKHWSTNVRDPGRTQLSNR